MRGLITHNRHILPFLLAIISLLMMGCVHQDNDIYNYGEGEEEKSYHTVCI